MKKKRIIFGIAALSLLTAGPNAMAQEDAEVETTQIVIEPLFDYPVAPEELEGLGEKTDYLVKNFWNNFDFKKAKVVDQHALNDAFETYCSFMPYASEGIVLKSVDDLIGKLKKNPALTIQFTKAAEEVLYGPRARMWIDEIYIKFLENLVSNKKIDKNKKLKYEDQLSMLKGSINGANAYRFGYVTLDGNRKQFHPKAKYSLLIFGNPECEDCRSAKLRLDISSVLNDMIYDKKLDVFFIIADSDEEDNLLKKTADYPSKWEVGQSPDAEDHYDLRAAPAIYILDQGGKIIAKNVSANDAIDILEELSKQ